MGKHNAPAAPGFCKCGDHHPHPATATWCYVCDRPLLPVDLRPAVQRGIVPTGTGWPAKS